ncbi:MAG: helix-turn-helix domain-containing protein [Lachnospiraceae bacterium]|nr:helix-turn-helix domain-containing protein [Lachnospiraceae bacterium]
MVNRPGVGKMGMHLKDIKLPLKKIYYILFACFIVIPLLIVLLISLLILNRRFKEQAIENIQRTQETIATELTLDIRTMSLRLSHLVHTNNNEMLNYASLADTDDTELRYQYTQKLEESGSLVLEPTSSLISVSFYMKEGRHTYIKSEVTIPEVKNTEWYQQALQDQNQVYSGSYHIKEKNEVYLGSKGQSMLLTFALAPDRTTDRNEKIEMVVLYYATDVSDKIAAYNKNYLNGKNNLGIMQIVDENGNILFSSGSEQLTDSERLPEAEEFNGEQFSDAEQVAEAKGYTCIRTPVDVNNATWYVESYIETKALTGDFWQIASAILIVATCVLAFAGYFSRFLIKSIVSPIEEISDGLKQVEEGNLNIHIAAQGQSEIRNMIHQFNAMVRRIGALIGEYEEQIRNAKVTPADYLAAMIRKEMTPQEVAERTTEFFTEEYVVLGIYMVTKARAENNSETMSEIVRCCERNPRFASRCISYVESKRSIVAVYRIMEPEYYDTLVRMIQDLQKEVYRKLDVQICVCISKPAKEPEDFYPCINSVREHICFRHLYGENAIIDLHKDEELIRKIEQEAPGYTKLAEALYIADEKNVSDEKERIFAAFINRDMEEIRITVLAVILAIGNVFDKDNDSFSEIFGQQNNYIEKVGRIEGAKSIKLWLTNYCAWILNYSAAKVKVSETDMIVRAKRYIADHCEDAELSLTEVAEYVGLNEKYFTNRFTKETGETFSSYLTALRMQKARELLKTTTFKIYEISEMAGYRNVEHFNRVFKKINGVTPAQFRKTM